MARRSRTIAGTVGLVLLLGASLTGAATAAPAAKGPGPEVVKVEPPTWWPGHSMNPVRLLVRGKNLAGAHGRRGRGQRPRGRGSVTRQRGGHATCSWT